MKFRGDKNAPMRRRVETWDGSKWVMFKLPPEFLRQGHSVYTWGYCGSGPIDLACALLAHVVLPEQACLYCQAFMLDVIVPMKADRWEMAAADVLRWFRDNATPDRVSSAAVGDEVNFCRHRLTKAAMREVKARRRK
jgi:hypothetical protein